MVSDPVNELRALLLQFGRSGLKDMSIRSANWAVFMAQPDGAANPFSLAASADAVFDTVSAPHLGLFEPVCSPGDLVVAGQLVARIDVLGRKSEVTSISAGRVAEVHFAANELVEFGQALVTIAAS